MSAASVCRVLDPYDQRAISLLNDAAKHRGRRSEYYAATHFDQTIEEASTSAWALRALVVAVSNAVRAWEHAINTGQPTMEAEKALLAFKVPHARDLMDEAFAEAMNVPTGVSRLGTFHAALAARNIGVMIVPPPT